MNYSHTMSCSNCLQDLTSHHIPQHTSAREEACKACMHITFHTVKWNNHSNQKYSSFIHQLPMKQKTYHAQLQDSEHGPQAKTCTNNESKHVFFKLLQGQMNYSHTMSCSNCLRNLTRHHIPQHTSAREEACKACMHITFHTVALLQGMHAHHISFFQYYLRLQQIQMNLTQWTNCTCFLLPPAYQNKNKTWHPQLHTKATPQTLYLPHTTQQMSTTTLCLSNVIALSASDRPAKKQLSPKMQKAYVCIYIYIHDMHQTAPPTKSSWVPRCHASEHTAATTYHGVCQPWRQMLATVPLATLRCNWPCSAQHWFAIHALQPPKRTPKFETLEHAAPTLAPPAHLP